LEGFLEYLDVNVTIKQKSQRFKHIVCFDEKRLCDLLHAVTRKDWPISLVNETTGRNKAVEFNIPGWNSVVQSKQQIAKAAFWLWINCNAPKTDGIYRYMV